MCQNIDLRFLPFIAFCQVFLPAHFHFLLSVLLPFLFFRFGFLHPLFFLFFFTLVLSLFFSLVILSLAYPNLLGIKGLVVVVVGGQNSDYCNL
jgi:hypothetical protein